MQMNFVARVAVWLCYSNEIITFNHNNDNRYHIMMTLFCSSTIRYCYQPQKTYKSNSFDMTFILLNLIRINVVSSPSKTDTKICHAKTGLVIVKYIFWIVRYRYCQLSRSLWICHEYSYLILWGSLKRPLLYHIRNC